MELYYHEVERDVLILAADGGLNAANAADFVEQIGALIDAGVRKIIVDCSALNFISSLGMSALLRIHKRMKDRGGEVKIAGVDTLVAQALALVHLDRVFGLYEDVDRARLAFRDIADAESDTN